MVRDLQQPRAHRAALGIEVVRLAPDDEEDVLHDVLGRLPVERLRRQREYPAREPGVQRAERTLRAPRTRCMSSASLISGLGAIWGAPFIG